MQEKNKSKNIKVFFLYGYSNDYKKKGSFSFSLNNKCYVTVYTNEYEFKISTMKPLICIGFIHQKRYLHIIGEM